VRRVLKLAAVGAAASLALAACGEAPDDNEGETPSTTQGAGADTGGETGDSTEEGTAAPGGEVAEDFQACMVSDAGGFDDQSFNQSGKEGLDAAAEELGIETTEVQSQSDSDYAPNVGNLVSQGCDLTIGVGFLLADAIGQAAEQNPDTNFALIDSGFEAELDNAKPLLFNTAEASFLAGYLAAGMSETGTVATFGGLQIPSVSIFMDGFYDGVNKYNEDTGEDVQLLGWDKEGQTGSFSGDFENQSQGQTLTEQFLAQGADIIMPVAGPVGLGAAAAVSEADGAKLIWVDSDGYLTASEYGEYMLTSVMKGIGAAVQDSVREAAEGNFTNEPYVGTLENEGVGLAPFHDFEGEVPQELVDKIEEYKQQIISGELTVETPNAP
jgi:basic membrane protein A